MTNQGVMHEMCISCREGLYVLVAKSSCSSSKVPVLWGKDILFPLQRYRLIAWDDTSY